MDINNNITSNHIEEINNNNSSSSSNNNNNNSNSNNLIYNNSNNNVLLNSNAAKLKIGHAINSDKSINTTHSTISDDNNNINHQNKDDVIKDNETDSSSHDDDDDNDDSSSDHSSQHSTETSDSEDDNHKLNLSLPYMVIKRDHCYCPSTKSAITNTPENTPQKTHDNTALSATIPSYRLAYSPAVPTNSSILVRLLQLTPQKAGSSLQQSRTAQMFTADRSHMTVTSRDKFSQNFTIRNPFNPEIRTKLNSAALLREHIKNDKSQTKTGSNANYIASLLSKKIIKDNKFMNRTGKHCQPFLFSNAKKRSLLKRKNSHNDYKNASNLNQTSDSEIDDISIHSIRRSDRNIGKKRKYRYEVDLNLSEESGDASSKPNNKKNQSSILVRPSQLSNPIPSIMTTPGDMFQPSIEDYDDEEEYIVDKILDCRQVGQDNESLKQTTNDESQEDIICSGEQFLIKFKGYSYLHVKWCSSERLIELDRRVLQKINRYKQKNSSGFDFFDDEPFNSDFLQVDRILSRDVVNIEATKQTYIFYLVKWCSLPYEECSWELKDNILDENKVRLFESFNKIPAQSNLMHKLRPHSEIPISQEVKQYKNGNILRNYQQVGVKWLIMKWFSRQNCILADEMGLGKTIQTIAFLNEVMNYGIRGPFLIIVPLSTIQNWYREFQNWTDMNAIVFHGSAISRKLILEYEFYYRSIMDRKGVNFYKFNTLITTYEALMNDTGDLSNVPWRMCVIDEAHRLKNTRCKLSSHLKVFQLDHRILLTGTPLQNSVEELWSLLNFLDPNQFDSDQDFMSKYGQLKSEEQVLELQKILKPMMLRRLKEDVEKSIAPKEETIIEVELTAIQKKYYRAILERNFTHVVSKMTSRNIPNLMNLFMELRKCCNHPYLIKGAENQIISELLNFNPGNVIKLLVEASGKLVLVDKLLPKLKQGDHKVLIFSQMVRCLDILEDYLITKRYPYERIDGQVRGNLRQAAIDRFSKPGSDRFVFLLCTRAGGLGINLTAADTVIIYDSDWNPQNDLQAQARCHRIGQDKPVQIYRLITRNSYEREMFDRASMKLGLDKAVLQSVNNGQKEQNGQLSKKEIEELLKKGAYGALMDEDDIASKFCNEDIEDILERRTQVVTFDDTGNKNSLFAKVSFVSSEGDTEISIDDPNFWHKWAEKAEIDLAKFQNKPHNLILDVPRERKQTKRFNQDKSDPSYDVTAEAEMHSADSYSEEESAAPTQMETAVPKSHHVRQDLDPPPLHRSICMKIESALMTFGWGRWNMMLANYDLTQASPPYLETVCRNILLYSLSYFKGDEKVRTIILSLIDPSLSHEWNEPNEHQAFITKEEFDVLITQSIDTLFPDSAYKRHLQRVSGRVLQRIRVLHHIKYVMIGVLNYERLMENDLHVDQFDVELPEIDNPPTSWWNKSSDKSLILGTIKYGYENFSAMAEDSQLVFCPPALISQLSEAEEKGIKTNINIISNNNDNDNIVNNDNSNSINIAEFHNMEIDDCSMDALENDDRSPVKNWPSVAELNNRLKKMVTESDRNLKRIVQKSERNAIKAQKQELKRAAREKLSQDGPKTNIQIAKNHVLTTSNKWTLQEEHEFSRAIYSYGVVFDYYAKQHDWSTIRQLARLKKTHDQIENFYNDFIAMLYSVCGKEPGSFVPSNGHHLPLVKEEKARKVLKRIHLLSLIREVLVSSHLEQRLLLCQKSSETPSWWVFPTHDYDLLKAVSKYGFGKKASFDIYSDQEFAFLESVPISDDIDKQAIENRQVPSKWLKDKSTLRRTIKLVFLIKKGIWPKNIPNLPTGKLDLSVYGPNADTFRRKTSVGRKRKSINEGEELRSDSELSATSDSHRHAITNKPMQLIISIPLYVEGEDLSDSCSSIDSSSSQSLSAGEDGSSDESEHSDSSNSVSKLDTPSLDKLTHNSINTNSPNNNNNNNKNNNNNNSNSNNNNDSNNNNNDNNNDNNNNNNNNNNNDNNDNNNSNLDISDNAILIPNIAYIMPPTQSSPPPQPIQTPPLIDTSLTISIPFHLLSQYTI